VKSRAPGLACAVLLCAPVHAQQNSPQRVHAFAALPNWTGLWETETSAALVSGEIEASVARAAEAARKSGAPPPAEGLLDPVETEFMRRTELMAPPPYKLEWQKKYQAALVMLKHPARTRPTILKGCNWGFPLLMDTPVPDGMFQALVTPEETLLLFRSGEVRHIYTDGRPHPKKEDLWPTDIGDSIGHWDGATLVIDTIERKAGPLFPPPFVSADLSEHAHFVERLHMSGANTMQNDMTIEDPLRLARPWKVSIRYKRVTDMDRMIATNCTENDRNPVVDGKVTIAPP